MHISGRTEGELVLVAAYVVMAAIMNLPPDRKDFNFYDWFYATSHSLLNSPMAMRLQQRFQISEPNGKVTTETKTIETPAKSS